jgi:futalosine hydrolase
LRHRDAHVTLPIHELQTRRKPRMPRHLILVPTEMERRILDPILAPAAGSGCHVALCGFGPVSAAARTAHLLAEHVPERVLLVGIAGRLDDRLALGAAYRFERVACFGVGAGSGGEFVPAGALGWQQWPGDADGTAPPIGDQIGDLISCQAGGTAGGGRAELLLTVCAAASSAEDVRLRRHAFPAATAEDMEGFAVAFACRLRGVPVDIVRGISNTAGDRDKSHWQVADALEAAGRLALQIMAEAS